MDAMDSIREEGIKFDENLEKEYGEFFRYLAKIIINLVSPALKDNPQREWYLQSQTYLAPIINGDSIGNFAQLALDKKYPWSYVKKIIDMHIDGNQYWPCVSFEDLVSLFPCEILSDSGALEKICESILAKEPKAIADYKKGKTNSLNHLKGLVMRETKGKADIQMVEKILKEKMI